MNKAGVLNAIKEFRFPEPIAGEVILFSDRHEELVCWRVNVDAEDIGESQVERTYLPTDMYVEIVDARISGKLLTKGKLGLSRFLGVGASEVSGYAKRWQADGSSYLVSVLR